MELSDDIITAVPRGPTVAKSAVQPDPRLPVTGRNGDNSHHSSYCFHCRNAHQIRSRQCPRYHLDQDNLQLDNSQFISLGSARHEFLYRQKDGTGLTSYASLAARSSAESPGPKTTPFATSHSVGACGPVRLANRFALLSDDSVKSSE
ncbi:hypothetical protein E2C01_059411 [Portunus trituberculatus]|uniref:Uncharacterized protein n=1 Tax=Portunus trituberculatus TaxID=210409 RepID=A0A5B7H8A0_PORTR|nr:hypothetical protein [Portunus trituberculatus]